jgi:hypothetical protein
MEEKKKKKKNKAKVFRLDGIAGNKIGKVIKEVR